MNEDKFNGMGEIYAEFRPSYPEELFRYLFTEVGMTPAAVIADIGAGTGIFTKQLLDCGTTVLAVEPNDDMRAIAEKDLKKYQSFRSVKGTAENTALEAASVDFMTVAQAFHWFDRVSFKAECKRVLKPGGFVVLVWNSRDENSELVKENDRLNRRYCPNFKGFSGGMRGAMAEDDFSDFFCGNYVSKQFQNPLSFHEQGFIGRNLSASYALKKEDPRYQDYIEELKALFNEYSQNGTLIMPNFTRGYVGRP